ncbi:hypothetical protein BCD48_01090 [Pseudofrankia sp. BMG5.36]|nr:hypothetical protein BCD48_01090 [Pseudofrankia sp. BMG5.36]
MAAHHCGHSAAIWASVAPGPRWRAAIVHRESPRWTTTSVREPSSDGPPIPRGAEPPSGSRPGEGELEGEGDESGGDRSGQPEAGIAAGRRTDAGGSLVGIVGVQGVGLADGVGEAAGVHVGSAV